MSADADIIAKIITGSHWKKRLFFDGRELEPQSIRIAGIVEKHAVVRVKKGALRCISVRDFAKSVASGKILEDSTP
jgi:hypothetical protein